MSREKIGVGCRIGCIAYADRTRIELIGFGVRIEDSKHPRKETIHPCILLDNGDKIWGCDCWWGSEKSAKMTLELYPENQIKIVKKRS